MLVFDEVSWLGLLVIFCRPCKNCAPINCSSFTQSVQGKGLEISMPAESPLIVAVCLPKVGDIAMHRGVEQPNDLMYRANRRTAILTPLVCFRVPVSKT